MKTLACLILILVVAPLAGCAGDGSGDCCGEFQARCCGWEFYKPCDLIEGKRGACDIDPCAVEVRPCAPAAEAAAPETAPEPAPVEEAPAGS